MKFFKVTVQQNYHGNVLLSYWENCLKFVFSTSKDVNTVCFNFPITQYICNMTTTIFESKATLPIYLQVYCF